MSTRYRVLEKVVFSPRSTYFFTLLLVKVYFRRLIVPRDQSFTWLMADLCQNINGGFAFSKCLLRTKFRQIHFVLWHLLNEQVMFMSQRFGTSEGILSPVLFNITSRKECLGKSLLNHIWGKKGIKQHALELNKF